MTAEQIVLIFALFGSAKVAFDVVVSLFKWPIGANVKKRTIERLLRMNELLDSKADELLRRNQALESEIASIKSGQFHIGNK